MGVGTCAGAGGGVESEAAGADARRAKVRVPEWVVARVLAQALTKQAKAQARTRTRVPRAWA